MTGQPPDNLSIIVYAGDFDKIHYALATAAAAAAIGKTVTLFFTMDACKALGADEAWRGLPLSQGNAAGITSASDMDDDFKARGVADFETLLASCVELEVTFMICEMGLRARSLETMSIRDETPVRQGGLVTFLSQASKDGAMLFI